MRSTTMSSISLDASLTEALMDLALRLSSLCPSSKVFLLVEGDGGRRVCGSPDLTRAYFNGHLFPLMKDKIVELRNDAALLETTPETLTRSPSRSPSRSPLPSADDSENIVMLEEFVEDLPQRPGKCLLSSCGYDASQSYSSVSKKSVNDAATEPGRLTLYPSDAASQPKRRVLSSTDAASEPKRLAVNSTDASSEPKKRALDSTDAISEQERPAMNSTNAAPAPKRLALNSMDAASEPKRRSLNSTDCSIWDAASSAEEPPQTALSLFDPSTMPHDTDPVTDTVKVENDEDDDDDIIQVDFRLDDSPQPEAMSGNPFHGLFDLPRFTSLLNVQTPPPRRQSTSPTEMAAVAATAETNLVTIANPQYLRPLFEYGWRREIVFRSCEFAKKRTDTYYWTPEGNKCRTMNQVEQYLERSGNYDLSRSNFSFGNFLVEGGENETMRVAAKNKKWTNVDSQ